jgi:beta-lactamase class D
MILDRLTTMATMVLVYTTFFLVTGCSSNNVTANKELAKNFDSGGCFAIFDNANGQFTIYNLALYRDTALAPAETFYPIAVMTAISTGKILNENQLITSSNTTGNPPLTLADAVKLNATAHLVALTKQIGKDTLQMYLDSLSYSNKQKITGIDSALIHNQLSITPDEQLGIITKLYFEKLPGFDKRSQRIVKQLLLKENNAAYKLSYTTGHSNTHSWVCGWVEENKHFYPFVQLSRGSVSNTQVMTTLKANLKQLGFLEGKK